MVIIINNIIQSIYAHAYSMLCESETRHLGTVYGLDLGVKEATNMGRESPRARGLRARSQKTSMVTCQIQLTRYTILLLPFSFDSHIPS